MVPPDREESPMFKGRLFVVGQLFFFTLPLALGLSVYLANATDNALLPFLALLPYMGVALISQMFRCPSCGERVFSLKRASEMGYRKYLAPKLAVLKCPNCTTAFWRPDGSRL